MMGNSIEDLNLVIASYEKEAREIEEKLHEDRNRLLYINQCIYSAKQELSKVKNAGLRHLRIIK